MRHTQIFEPRGLLLSKSGNLSQITKICSKESVKSRTNVLLLSISRGELFARSTFLRAR
jgi:hypothetical protein